MNRKKILQIIKRIVLKPFRSFKNFIAIDLRKVMRNFGDHDGELSTCALAFFLLISFIPLSLVVISALSFFYNSDELAIFYFKQLKYQLPRINIDQYISTIDRIIFKKRHLAFIWIPFLFWWGSFIFDIIERGLVKAFRINEYRLYWKAKIRHFIIIFGMAFLIVFLTLFSNFVVVVKNTGILRLIEENLSAFGFLNTLLLKIEHIPLYLSAITTLVMNTLLIFIIYRFVPPRKLNSKSLIKGALFASLSYEIVKSIFSYYITEINDYSSIFGSLNTVVILMIWIWYTCFLFIFGAELAWVYYEKDNGRKRAIKKRKERKKSGKR
jgi:membrane protein